MTVREERAERKARNKLAKQVANQEIETLRSGHALAKYLPDLKDVVHEDEFETD
jgi:hypothetical protein